MNKQEIFTKLTRDERLHFLLALAHELTIAGRENYELDGSGLTRPDRLRAINEIQHRILASCLALSANDPRRYPDEILLQIILDHPEDIELQDQVRHYFDHVSSLVGAVG